MSADFYTYCDHGIYYGWLGRCQDCTSRGNVAVGTQAPGYGVEPRRPRLRDAAMWSAFVHELRAEVAEARMALDVSADDLRAVSYVVCAGNKDAARRVFDAIVAARDACRRAPHAEHSDRVLAKLRAMTPEELRRTFIDAGIFDESGNLTEPYRG